MAGETANDVAVTKHDGTECVEMHARFGERAREFFSKHRARLGLNIENLPVNEWRSGAIRSDDTSRDTPKGKSNANH